MNPEVNELLTKLSHPLQSNIEKVRNIIFQSAPELTENVKWNGPNYALNGQDCLTMRLQPGGAFQLILHTGAKPKQQLPKKMLAEDFGLLDWKTNDRAVLDLKKDAQFEKAVPYLPQLIQGWLSAIK